MVCEKICCYLPSKVNCCDKIGFLCFYCNCLYIPGQIEYWFPCIHNSSECRCKCTCNNPMQNVQSYDDFDTLLVKTPNNGVFQVGTFY
jgi:hypothetical protein